MRHILLCLVVFYVSFSSSFSQSADDPVVASINSHQIKSSQFTRRYINFLTATGIKDNYKSRKSVLNNMINEIMLYDYDDNKDVFDDAEYKRELEWTNKQTIISYLKDQEVYAKLTASDKELRDAFVKSNEELAARHLFAPTLEEADNLYQLLKIGISFDSLAKQTFTDSVLKNNGGYLGYFKWGDMDPTFEDTVFSMKIGDISRPVKTAYGYSIIKLEDRYIKPILTENEFQNEKSSLERNVKIRKKVPAEKAYIAKIFDWTKLNFYEKSLQNILNKISGNFIDGLEIKNSTDEKEACVEYDGTEYTQHEIEQMLDEIPTYHYNKIVSIENLKSVIEGLLIQEKLIEIAKSKGYDKLPRVADAFKLIRTNLFMNYKRKHVVADWDIPDSLVAQFYNNNKHLFQTPQEINVQEIIVDDKFLADSLVNLLQSGADFSELAKSYSLRTWSAENGGVLGLAPLSKFGIFKQILWESPVKDVVGPLQIEDLYGIFRVLEKKESSPIELSIVKEDAKSMAKQERQNSFFIGYIDSLRENYDIRIDENILSNIKIHFDSL